MSNWESFPGDPGGSAAQDVAGLLAGIALPLIERFGSDNEALAGLDDHALYPLSGSEPVTRASVARSVVAEGVLALEVVRVLENSLAACKAGLVDRVLGAVAVESAATELSRYQAGVAETGCVAEIALALGIPERTAAALGAHAVELQSHPRTRAALGAGVLSWRHAVTIVNELGTLGETPGVTADDAVVLEGRLLVLAEGATASRFASKARRARELMFPDSLEARTKQAFRGRKITNDPGKDGMNWLELHIPTIAANAIMVHCTRAARAIKADALERQRDAVARGTGEDCREYRTLDQLRADVAAILLMGQELPDNARYTSSNSTHNNSSSSNASGSGTSTSSNGTSGSSAKSGSGNSNGTSGDGGGWGAESSGTAWWGSAGCSDSDQGIPSGDAFNDPTGNVGDAGSSGGASRKAGQAEGHDAGQYASQGDDTGVGDSAGDSEGAGAGVGGLGVPGQGVGFVAFGENSAFGVSLIDVEPPWAHALPFTQVQHGVGEGQLAAGGGLAATRGTTAGSDTGCGDGVGDGAASGVVTGGGVVPGCGGTGVVAAADDGDVLLEGTVVPGGPGGPDAAGPGGPGSGGSEAGDPGCSGPAGPTGRGGSGAGGFRGRGGSFVGGDVPVEGFVLGDGSGFVNGVVDGVTEKPAWELLEQEAYLEQLTRLGEQPVLADPPMPKVLGLLKVSFLGLLGITDEPAELDDSTAGPVPLSIARRLLAGSSTFLRVLTDPITGEGLPLEPERYTLRNSERSVLQALAGGCYFPNCTEPVMDTDLDHVKSFESGGRSTLVNLRPACKRHHRLKHFKDDKDRRGKYRRWAEPWRDGIRLRGWTPRLCSDGRVGWVSPSGTYRAPERTGPQRPAYPKWLKKRLAKALATPEVPDAPVPPSA